MSEGIGREAGEGERPLLVVKLLADRAFAAAIHRSPSAVTDAISGNFLGEILYISALQTPNRPSNGLLVQVGTLSSPPIPGFVFLSFFLPKRRCSCATMMRLRQ